MGLTEEQLTNYVAATAKGTPDPDTTLIETVNRELTHVHLPALEAAGFITWQQTEGIVDTTTHPALDDPRFERLLKTTTEGIDEVFSVLSHEYRRVALTVLKAEQGPLSRSVLGQEIRRRAPETTGADISSAEKITISLHHGHLPVLDEKGFIEYDPETGQATYAGRPLLEDVFTIIQGRDESVAEKLDGFVEGLADSYQHASRETNTPLEWPHFWRGPYHG